MAGSGQVATMQSDQPINSGSNRSRGPPTHGGLMWNGLSSPGFGVGGVGFLGASDRRSGVLFAAEQASGPRGQGGAPAAKRGRTTLTPGWRLLRHLGPMVVGGCGRGAGDAPGGWWAGRQTDVRALVSQEGVAQRGAPD